MEDSLFSTQQQQPAANDILLRALIAQGVGKRIKEDTTPGKHRILEKLVPRTRGLNRLIRGIDENNDEIRINGADDAVEVLEVMYDVMKNRFTISE
ncbi:hypothetical protein [Diatraea saccharalis granulovirus]|uniref:P12 n=1 Tax=Diatraea saccharalis granulovirus TaxID=1675862 RepID=A0A0R7EYT3_9BBAC|nr:hypothetical protein [Diatraea saccharalis granulovirus]AKN80735.1 hypothetical protein [Diatraea saccharalis granulovirus]